jgi:ubiquitin carboxyl-terminal hydrolase 10
MTRIFGGKFRSTLRVPHQRDSVIVEDWRSLRLDIQVGHFPIPSKLTADQLILTQRDTIHTIKDALMHISTPQSVQVTSITRPGATLDATQQVHIDSLPPILILHLKRFLYDANKGGVAKVGKQVAFAPELEVGSEVMVQGRKVNGTRYRLFGGASVSVCFHAHHK